MKNKNTKRFFALCLAMCMSMCMMATNAFAAEVTSVPENSVGSNNGEMSTRAVEYNQVWIDAGRTKAGSFTVTNPHPLAGDGECRLRLESNASGVRMSVTVYAGTTTYFSSIITVGQDYTFEFNSFASEFVVHYSVVEYSSSYGMRLNCWLS